MSEENRNQELRLRKTDEIRNYLIEEINQNCINHLLIVTSKDTICVCISALASLVDRYSNRNCRFCNQIKNLFNNCRN